MPKKSIRREKHILPKGGSRGFFRPSIVLSVLAVLAAALLLPTLDYRLPTVQAITGPSTSPGVGTGAVGVDASRNLSVGTSTVDPYSKLFILASSTDNAGFALRVFQPGSGPLFVVRNDGTVGVGYDVPKDQTLGYRFYVTGNANVSGSVTAESFSGSLAGTLAAGNVSSGAFGANTGGGNYSFPASVGIGIATPQAVLEVNTLTEGAIFGTNTGLWVEGGNNVNNLAQIGLGYSGGVGGRVPPAVIAWRANAGSAYEGDLVFATANRADYLTAPTVKLTIKDDGNVGIGTTSPQAPLDVRWGVTIATNDYVDSSVGSKINIGPVASTGNTASYLQAYTVGATAYGNIGINPSGGNVGIATTTPAYALSVQGQANASGGLCIAGDCKTSWSQVAAATGWTDGGTSVYLSTDSDSVGIGTANPVFKTHIMTGGSAGTDPAWEGSGRSVLLLENNNEVHLALFTPNNTSGRIMFSDPENKNAGVINYNHATDAMEFYTAGSERLRINSSGDIGLATSSPAYKLDVVGSGRISGTLVVGTPTANSHAATKSYVDTVAAGGTLLSRSGTYTYMTNTGDNFGVGTANPGYKLTVSGTLGVTGATTLTSTVLGAANVTGNDGNLFIYSTDSMAINKGGSLSFGGAYTGTSLAQWAGIRGLKENATDSNVAGYLTLETRAAAGTLSEKVRITSTGNVGIGTTGPSTRLHVSSGAGSAATSGVRFEGEYSNIQLYSTSVSSGARNWSINNAWNGWGTLEFRQSNAKDGDPLNAGTTRLMIDASGNVGIATSSPSYILDVLGAGRFTSTLNVGTPTANSHAATKNYVDTVAAGGTLLSRSGTDTYVTNTGDEFGIGVADPSQKLDINGDLAVTGGDIYFENTDSGGIRIYTDSSANNMQFLDGPNALPTLHGAIGIDDSYANALSNLSALGGNSLAVDGKGYFGGNVGIGTTGPIGKLQIGNHTFGGGNGVFDNSRIGAMVNGSLTSIIYASTYNDPTYPDYGLVFIHGPTTASYNVWSISPDGPAKGDSLSFIYGSNTANIHTLTPKVVFDGSGDVGIGDTTPSYKLDVTGTGQFTSTLVVGTPTASGHAATKNYVDTVAAGGTLLTRSGSYTYVTNTGDNFGIGTASPSDKLQVIGNIRLTDNGAGYLYKVSDSSATVIRTSRSDNTQEGLITTDGWGAFGFNRGVNMATSDGNVGIGTAGPNAKLEVSGGDTYLQGTSIGQSGGHYQEVGYNVGFTGTNDTYTYRFSDTAASIRLGYPSGGMEFRTAPTGTGGAALTLATKMTLAQDGSLGIGTSPSYKLDVSGTGQFTSTLVVGTPTASGHAATKNYVDTVAAGGTLLSRSGTDTYVTNTGDEFGIGTASPATKLDVKGFITARSSVTDQPITVSGWNGNAGGYFDVYYDNVVTNHISGGSAAGSTYFNGGNVGIGTTGPAVKLDVAGDFKAAGVSKYTLTRSSTGVVNDWVEIGKINTNGRAYWAKITVEGHWSDHLAVEEYEMFATYYDGGLSASWVELPIRNGKGYFTQNQFAVDARNVSTDGVYLRVRNKYGATFAGTLNITVETNSTLTQSSGSGSAGTVLSGYLGNDIGWQFPVTTGTNWANTTEGLYVVPSGSVSIGATSPSYKLDVQGTGQFTSTLVVGTPTASSHAATKSYVDTVAAGGTLWTRSGTYTYGTNTGDNFGIGTATPGTKLEVAGTFRVTADSDSIVNILNVGTNAVAMYGATGHDLYLGGNNTNQLRLKSTGVDVTGILTTTGNVGIGTTGPGQKLTVSPNSAMTFGLGGLPNPVASVGAYGANPSDGLGFFVQDTTSGYTGWVGAIRSGNENTAGWGTKTLRFQVPDGSGNVIDALAIKGISGNVGIGNTGPGYKLDVSGTGQFTSTLVVGTPTIASHAATKSYVDSAVSTGGSAACNADSTCEMNGANLNNGNITGVNKLTVTTLDPVYEIGGVKYATFGPSFAGGVKEEYTGKGKLSLANPKSEILNPKQAPSSKNPKGRLDIRNSDLDIGGAGYEYIIDFSKLKTGSDLWLWYKAVDFGRDNVEAIATAYGSPAVIYYEISGTKMIFRGDAPAEFSFRLTGKRHDWKKWPTLILDQGEKPSFILQ